MGKLTKEQQTYILVAIVLIAGVWYYTTNLLMPVITEIDQKQKQLTELKQKVESAEIQARRLPALQSELEQLQVTLNSMEKQLPREKDIPSILRIITREAATENLAFVSLSPVDPRRDGFFDVIEFNLTMTGTLSSFIRFVSSLGQQERIFQVDRLNLNLGSQTENSGVTNLTLTFTLKTYAYAG